MDTKGILTLFVAFAVLVVSYAQWRTANQKVVVDLYDRRLKVFKEIEDAISEVIREGNCSDATFWKFVRAKADSRFLFDKDVSDYLENLLQHKLAFLNTYKEALIENAPNRSALIEKRGNYILPSAHT